MTFFGQANNRLALYSEIHEIVFHGKGGYDWDTVYNMPIWLRKFTFNKIKEWYEQEQEQNQTAVENAKGKTTIPLPKNNSYKSKASKK